MSANKWDSTIYWDSSFTWGGSDIESFDWEPQYIFSEIVGIRTNIFVTDTGQEFRYAKGQARREFSLVFSAVDITIKDGILAFYNANEGRNSTFYWVNPNDSVTYEVRFKADTLDVDYIDYSMYNIKLSLMEII